MSPVTFWFDWCWKAFCTMPEFLGGNWRGAMFACVCVFFYEAHSFHKSDSFKESTTRREQLRALGAFLMAHWGTTLKWWLFVAVMFFIGHSLDLVYRHTDSLSEKNKGYATTISTNTAVCEKEKNDLRISSGAEKSRADTLTNQNRDQQNTINGCLNQAIKMLKPPAQKTTILSENFAPGSDVLTDKSGNQIGQWLLMTNINRGTTIVEVRCPRPLPAIPRVVVLRGGATILTHNQISTTDYQFTIQSAWTPQAPMLVQVALRDINESGYCTIGTTE
jgi:hypothetical protein